MNAHLSRRKLLARAATLAGIGVAPTLLTPARALAAGAASANTLVVIFQRGGCDGLNCVVPYRDGDYYAARPTIAIPPPGAVNGAIDLDGFFALHPALSGLRDAYHDGHLALLPTVHYPQAQHSHFESMRIVESASPDESDRGWLGRYLEQTPGTDAPIRALSLGTGTPQSLRGPRVVSTFEDLDIAALGASAEDEVELVSRLQAAYARPAPAGRRLEQLVRDNGHKLWDDTAFVADLGLAPFAAGGTAGYPDTPLGRALFRAAQLVRWDVGTEIITIDTGGWDTHAAQGGSTGRQSGLLADLGDSLGAFHRDMRDDLARVMVLVMTEFGRTIRENASLGTDHGAAATWMLMGGRVVGGVSLGGAAWPGVAPLGVQHSRELGYTVDFRDVMAEVLARHLLHPQIGAILPDHLPMPLGLIA